MSPRGTFNPLSEVHSGCRGSLVVGARACTAAGLAGLGKGLSLALRAGNSHSQRRHAWTPDLVGLGVPSLAVRTRRSNSKRSKRGLWPTFGSAGAILTQPPPRHGPLHCRPVADTLYSRTVPPPPQHGGPKMASNMAQNSRQPKMVQDSFRHASKRRQEGHQTVPSPNCVRS